MRRIRFDEAYEGIINAYNDCLEAAKVEGALLEDVKTVIRGDRTRPTPKPPAIWIFPMTSLNNQTMALSEDWTLPVQLIAVVKSNDPIKGYYESFKLASKARSVILKDRNLGLEYVRDTISNSFEATDEGTGNKSNLYAHYAILWTHFNVYE